MEETTQRKKRKYLLVTLIADTEKTYVLSIGYTFILFMKSYLKILERTQKDEKEVLKALEKSRYTENEEEQIYIARKIEEDSKRVAELGNKIEKLYDDWINKKISDNNFQRILEKSQAEQDLLTKRIEEMKEKLLQVR